MIPPRLILEINTRLWLRRLGGGSVVPLHHVPDEVIEAWEAQGFDAVWLMGVWKQSAASQMIASEHPGLHNDYTRILPDWTPEDVIGSPYSIADYRIPEAWGGEEALAEFRSRLREHGLRLILDFVPNHTARDHPWVTEHPDWYVQLSPEDFAKHPGHGFRARSVKGEVIIAHGKDPYFPPWTDTAQLDYRNENLQRAQIELLHRLAGLCDGIRCDVAMLILPDVFARVWPSLVQGGKPVPDFWQPAIAEIKRAHPDFCFIAETYWGLDMELNARGFDLTYDKELLDHLVSSKPLAREQFHVPAEMHRQRLRFLENHDEPRIASRLKFDKHQAAATWLFLLPSSTLVYDGQLEGYHTKSPIQLRRDPGQMPDQHVSEFYERLLTIVRGDAVRRGQWQLLLPRSAWIGNDTCRAVLAQGYDFEDEHVRVFVNWSEQRSQCYVDIGLGALHNREVVLRDQLGSKKFVRQGAELMMRGFYLDMEPWEAHAFTCEVRGVKAMAE